MNIDLKNEIFKTSKFSKIQIWRLGSTFGGLTNLNQYFFKWLNLISLLKNIWFYNLRFGLFTNKFLKKEELFLNWEFLNQNLSFFKRTQSSLFNENPAYGVKSLKVFKELVRGKINGVIITDTNFRKRTLYYLKTTGVFTITLSSNVQNPWFYSYPILVVSNSYLTQRMILKHFFL